MYLYLVGGTILELNLLMFAGHYYEVNGHLTNNLIVYVILFTFFLCEYFWHEYVHLYTFDFVAEAVGFKLTWGCLVFYPFFYPIGIWAIAEQNIPCQIRSNFVLFSVVALFVIGWCLSRGANNQKYLFKTKPKANYLFNLIQPKTINNKLLCSGFWSLSRHINYLGDTLMACSLALLCFIDCSSKTYLPWLYPMYYVLLFIFRERADNKICQKKYGYDWKEYCQRVPYRIIPFIY
ncbi:unnamed protein product [Didymodactylos carnosus]|uniref:Uncharacterized protein n=1 Tax=Didymodactylos carnosus TaxID=1234261 RepID=A0A813XGE9_9BILA|nr:unnamed protein product [Didymodactylos carnosus]CAF1405909.1 unnamed protein product [Didymodactylos carnosus]CAF3652421.1 unnamed protein product [Didymodactylos carnosus]CAF4211484.1 unnamed protein product [Didymodactylos carnosus]